MKHKTTIDNDDIKNLFSHLTCWQGGVTREVQNNRFFQFQSAQADKGSTDFWYPTVFLRPVFVCLPVFVVFPLFFWKSPFVVIILSALLRSLCSSHRSAVILPPCLPNQSLVVLISSCVFIVFALLVLLSSLYIVYSLAVSCSPVTFCMCLLRPAWFYLWIYWFEYWLILCLFVYFPPAACSTKLTLQTGQLWNCWIIRVILHNGYADGWLVIRHPTGRK